LIIAIIEPATDRGMSVLDIFGGSGSTMIACEKTNRKCRMMEINTIYCQVIIDRWEKFTSKKVEKIK
jgi:DNA modification methylase